jgi:chromosome segregation ATPase
MSDAKRNPQDLPVAALVTDFALEEITRLKSDLAIAQEKLDSERTHARDAEAALANEEQAHRTTKQELADQIRLSQGLERTANGLQQQFFSLDRQHQALHADAAQLDQDLKLKTARVEELNKDLAAAWDTNHALEQEVKALRAKAAERDITFQHNTELASALADANERVEALLRAAKSDAQNLALAEQERDDLQRKYKEAYDARAKVAANLSHVVSSTKDYDALKRTIRVAYAVVKVALDDLTADDHDEDANPDAAAHGLLDALALLDASGAFAHRSDR